MNRLIPYAILIGWMAGAGVAMGGFIPGHRLSHYLGQEITIEGLTGSSGGSIFNGMEVLDEEGYYAYDIYVFQYFPEKMRELCWQAYQNDQLVKCKISGTLLWDAPVEIFEGLFDPYPDPPGFSREFLDFHRHYYLYQPVFHSFEIVEDTTNRHIGQEFWARKAMPFEGAEGEADGFLIQNAEGKVVVVGRLANGKKWDEHILKTCIRPPVGQCKTIRIVGMVTNWKRHEGIQYFTVSSSKELPEIPQNSVRRR